MATRADKSGFAKEAHEKVRISLLNTSFFI